MTGKRFVVFQDSYDDLYIRDKEVYRATGIKVGNEEDVNYKNVLKIVELLNALSDENEQLKQELDYWKKRALLLEKKYNEGDSIKWLRENTVWEQMPSNKRTFTTTNIKEDKE